MRMQCGHNEPNPLLGSAYCNDCLLALGFLEEEQEDEENYNWLEVKGNGTRKRKKI